MQNDLSIKESVRSAFRLAQDAKVLRDAIAKILPTTVGRDHAVAHRAYTVLGDMVVAFAQLSDQIAASSSLGGHLVRPVAALSKARKSQCPAISARPRRIGAGER